MKALGVAAVVLAGALLGARQMSGADVAESVRASLPSKALESTLHFVVDLPPGYSAGSRRYPVVYFLHGLPAGPSSYLSLGWVQRALRRTGRQAILVVPQATRRPDGDPEYLDWGPGRDWATALGSELPAWVDRHFRTIANRDGRALVGVSAGGYGAASIGLRHPAEYSVVESWSGYFRPTDPTGEHTLHTGSADADARADLRRAVASLAAQFRRYPTYLAFYVGISDPTFVSANAAFDAALTAARVPHTFATYPGGHTTAFWKAHATSWLAAALDHLRPPS